MFKYITSLSFIFICLSLSELVHASDNINYNGYSFISKDDLGPVSKKKDKKNLKYSVGNIDPNQKVVEDSSNDSSNVKQQNPTNKQTKKISSGKIKNTNKDSLQKVSVISIKAASRQPSLKFDKDPMKVSVGYLNNNNQ